MLRRIILPLLLVGLVSWARDKQENWLKVSTQHFTVYCDGNEKQARHIADQFERMRAVFHVAFPDMKLDLSAPIVVIAVKNAKDFRALEPEAYLAKGALDLSGLFLRVPDKNYVLVRLDATGEHPYATVYHEYTHLLLGKTESWMPLWLDEGLAQFYENTAINEKETVLGEATSSRMEALRQGRLLPLTTLFTVDRSSPYYHDEQKGSVFYAESWALTHLLEVRDAQKNLNEIRDYAMLLAANVDAVTAAERSFGDLKQLQTALGRYIGQSSFYGFRLARPLPVDDTTFKVQAVTETQADSVRADFLAYNQRERDARALLEQVLHDDPNNTLAHETMGYLEFRARHLEEAQNWYQQAIKLDSQSYVANYYFGAIAMSREQPGSMDREIESSLRKAIKLNPDFAPSYDSLGVFYGARHENLDEAQMLSLQAVQLEPGDVHYRMTSANILLVMERYRDAVAVLQAAMKVAKTPEESSAVQAQLGMVQQALAAREAREESSRAEERVAEGAESEASVKTEPDSGPPLPKEQIHRFVTGTLKNVRCSMPAVMDMTMDDGGGKIIPLHSSNYYKIQFTAMGFVPSAELKPCSDLEGMRAKVEYIESVSNTNGVVSVEMRK